MFWDGIWEAGLTNLLKRCLVAVAAVVVFVVVLPLQISYVLCRCYFDCAYSDYCYSITTSVLFSVVVLFFLHFVLFYYMYYAW